MTVLQKEEIFNDIYARKFNAVKFLCMRYVDEDTAAQLAQDSFIKLYTHLDSFRNECRLDTWLYRITKNVCCNHLRMLRTSKRFAPTYSLNESNNRHSSSRFNTEKHGDSNEAWFEDKKPIFSKSIESQQILDIVNITINEMPLKYRQCLKAFMEPDGFCSYQEAAKKMKVPTNIARSRLSRARFFLKEKLKKFRFLEKQRS